MLLWINDTGDEAKLISVKFVMPGNKWFIGMGFAKFHDFSMTFDDFSKFHDFPWLFQKILFFQVFQVFQTLWEPWKACDIVWLSHYVRLQTTLSRSTTKSILNTPDSKVYGANMRPTWVLCWPHELCYLGLPQALVPTGHNDEWKLVYDLDKIFFFRIRIHAALLHQSMVYHHRYALHQL